MKTLVAFIFLVALGKISQAQLKPTDDGSTVQFKIKNFGFNTGGSFTGLSGTITFDPSHPEAAAFDVSVDAKTVNTDNNMRDDHLRQVTYFDIAKYPQIKLVSSKITGKKGAFVFTGKLTIKNHTKDISFPFTADASGSGYMFKGTFTINRKDFEVGGTSTISDNLDVTLNINAK